MPRQARVVAVGAPHHITERGNNRQDVFLLDEDRRTYFRFLSEDSRQCELRLLGYCLMTNHVHLVAIPGKADSLARTLRRAHSRYAQWFNRRYQRTGHLWQNRFFSCGLGREHLLTALAYVDLNPVRAGLVGLGAPPSTTVGRGSGWASTGRGAAGFFDGAAEHMPDRVACTAMPCRQGWGEAGHSAQTPGQRPDPSRPRSLTDCASDPGWV